MALLDDLTWRYATKKYDPSKKVSDKDIRTILEAARLAPTSSGLQQYRILVITNQDIKDKMVPIAAGQQIVAEASHVLVFAAWDRYTEERIDEIYNKTTDQRGLPRGRFSSYTISSKSLFATD